MATTLSQMLYELENYEYSREHFEMTKLAREIQLMELYEESQRFINDSIEELREDYSNINESYFFEADDSVASPSDDESNSNEEKKSGFMKKLGKKVADSTSKFWKGIVRIWKTIVTWFGKLLTRSKKTNTLVDEVRELFNFPLGDEVDAIITNAITHHWKAKFLEDGFMIDTKRQKVDFLGKNVLALSALSRKSKEGIDMRAKLAAALSPNKINIIPVNNDNGKSLVDIDQLIIGFENVLRDDMPTDEFNRNSYVGRGVASTIKLGISGLRRNVRLRGIVIDVTDEGRKKTQASLSKLSELLGKSTFFTDEVNAQLSDAKQLNSLGNKNAAKDAKGVPMWAEIYKDFTKMAGVVMSVYTSIEEYRRACSQELKQRLGALKKAAKSEDEE